MEELSKLVEEKGNNAPNAEEVSEWRKTEENLKNVMLALSSLVGARLLDKALSISSRRGSVTEVRAECGRSAYRIKGETGEYKVLLVGYCTCISFANERIGTTLPICKHILAVHLAKAQGTCDVQQVRDEQWARAGWGVNMNV